MPYIKKADLLKLLRAGNLLSNIAYNLKQDKRYPEHIRKSLEEYQKEWDSIKRRIR